MSKHAVSKIGVRYRSKRVDELTEASNIDHIVIGSGMGGLTCAASLAKAGKKVLVLEQHYTAGGFTHCYERNGYEWDVGVHYIGQMGSRYTGPGALFNWISDGRLKWDSLGEVYDRFLIDGRSYALPLGKSAYKEFLHQHFPKEKKAIEAYFKRLTSVERWLPFFFATKFRSIPGLVKASRLLEKCVPADYRKTTSEVFDGLTDNAELKAVWAGQWGDLGLPPSRSSFFLHCLIASHYLDGGWYPRGGSAEIARSILPTIEDAGGAVMTYAEVDEIVTDEQGSNTRVTGVKMKNGQFIECASVISSCGWLNTQGMLSSSSASLLHKDINEEQVYESACHICLYVGFDTSVDALNIPTGNLWVHHSNNFSDDLARFEEDSSQPLPFVYISSSAARDTTWSKRYPDKSVMELVAVVPQDEFAQWQGSDWGKRGAEYEAKKEAWSQRLLDVLYEQYPQLKGKVDYYELSSPLSTQFFMKHQQGEIYGLAHTPDRYKQSGLRPKTDIEGLFLAGQDALTSGVVGAAMSGAFAAVEVLGDDYQQQLLNWFRSPLKRLSKKAKLINPLSAS